MYIVGEYRGRGRFGGFGESEVIYSSSGELGGLEAAVEIGSRAKAAS